MWKGLQTMIDYAKKKRMPFDGCSFGKNKTAQVIFLKHPLEVMNFV